jgi:hypothetical protein
MLHNLKEMHLMATQKFKPAASKPEPTARVSPLLSPENITATVQAMADLMWQFEAMDREVFVPMVSRMLVDPDHAPQVVKFMKVIATCQKPLTSNPALNSWMKGQAS